MSVASTDLWNLIPGGREVDPNALASAIGRQVEIGDLDFRTRLLIRDSLDALARYWGGERVSRWLDGSEHGAAIRRIWQEDLGRPGFPSLAWRVMDPTTPDIISQFLRELGARLRVPTRVFIGGSAALIMPGLLTRRTDDIDVVDELPESLRGEFGLLDDLATRHGLRLAHFQSHYLPAGWQARTHSLGKFRELEAHLVDPYDVALSKLFSSRSKDLDDLRYVGSRLDKDEFRRRLLQSGSALRAEPKLGAAAETNWYILYGEPLPAS
jgi:hypothetical protein